MHRIAVCLVVSLAVGLPARGQFTQYSAPGSSIDPVEDAAEAAEQAAQEARWRFARLRLHPHLTLTDVGYVQNVFSAPEGSRQVDDSRATLGAGLAGYIRLGSQGLLTGYVASKYHYWQDSEDLRELTIDSGLAWFGDFNRLQLSAIARDSESQAQLSSEVEAPVTISQEHLGFEATVAITSSLALFGEATESRTRHGRELEQFVPGLAVRSLDRDSDRQRVGVELRSADFEFGLGFERTEVDFLDSNVRDNTGEGPLLRLGYKSGRLEASGEYSALDFEFESSARSSSTRTIGSALIALEFRPKTTASLYFSDRLAFTTFSNEGILDFESRGLAIRQGLGRRMEATVFGEMGRQTFDDPRNPGREDDLDAFGLSMRFDLTETLTLTANVRDEQWDSNFLGFDRSSASVGFSVEVDGDLLPW